MRYTERAINLTGNELANIILGNQGSNIITGGGAPTCSSLWRQRHLLCQFRQREVLERHGRRQ